MKNIIRVSFLLLLMYACNNIEIKKEYYPNGNLLRETEYKVGKLYYNKVYFENGNLNWEASYNNNAIDGKYLQYYENGKLQIDSEFKEGKQDGLTIEYFNTGKIKSKIQFKNGENDGYMKLFYENGKLNIDAYYEKGLIYCTKNFDKNGVFTDEFHFAEIYLQDSVLKLGDTLRAKVRLYGKIDHDYLLAGKILEDIEKSIKKIDIIDEWGKYEYVPKAKGNYIFDIALSFPNLDTAVFTNSKYFIVE